MRRTAVVAVIAVTILCAPASAARTPTLYAWAVEYHKPIVGVSKVGHNDDTGVARHVAPGRYRLDIIAQSDLAFHLYGPGLNRQTQFASGYNQRVHEVWTIRLRRGGYHYSGAGLYAKQLRQAGVKVSGSFAAP